MGFGGDFGTTVGKVGAGAVGGYVMGRSTATLLMMTPLNAFAGIGGLGMSMVGGSIGASAFITNDYNLWGKTMDWQQWWNIMSENLWGAASGALAYSSPM